MDHGTGRNRRAGLENYLFEKHSCKFLTMKDSQNADKIFGEMQSRASEGTFLFTEGNAPGKVREWSIVAKA